MDELNSLQIPLVFDVNSIVEFLQEVRVQVIVIAGKCVKTHQYIFFHSDVIHYLDKIQESLLHISQCHRNVSSNYHHHCAASYLHLLGIKLSEKQYQTGLQILLGITSGYKFFDAASAGQIRTAVPGGSIFFACPYLIPFEQKYESQ